MMTTPKLFQFAPREAVVPVQAGRVTHRWPWVVVWQESGVGLMQHRAGMNSRALANDLAAWLVGKGWTVEVQRGRRRRS